MSTTSISGDCKSNKHLECLDCMCKCHIPGTMENLAKKIAKLEKDTPGVGESLLLWFYFLTSNIIFQSYHVVLSFPVKDVQTR
jgi:hypothetical protein